MPAKAEILTIRADHKTQKKFKETWRMFNKNRLGTVTQGDFLNHILNIVEKHITKIQEE